MPHSQEPWVRWDSRRQALSRGPRHPSAQQAHLRCQGPELWARDLPGHRRPKHTHGPCASHKREAHPCQNCSRWEAALDKGCISVHVPALGQLRAWVHNTHNRTDQTRPVHVQESPMCQRFRDPGEEAQPHLSPCPAGGRDAELEAAQLLLPPKEGSPATLGEARGAAAGQWGVGGGGRRPGAQPSLTPPGPGSHAPGSASWHGASRTPRPC